MAKFTQAHHAFVRSVGEIRPTVTTDLKPDGIWCFTAVLIGTTMNVDPDEFASGHSIHVSCEMGREDSVDIG